jgi:hypothetical protein
MDEPSFRESFGEHMAMKSLPEVELLAFHQPNSYSDYQFDQ